MWFSHLHFQFHDSKRKKSKDKENEYKCRKSHSRRIKKENCVQKEVFLTSCRIFYIGLWSYCAKMESENGKYSLIIFKEVTLRIFMDFLWGWNILIIFESIKKGFSIKPMKIVKFVTKKPLKSPNFYLIKLVIPSRSFIHTIIQLIE